MVKTSRRRVVIDPGVALAPLRFGLPPHPLELKRAESLRTEVLKEVAAATDIVISHFHGDHAPLLKPDPSQIPLNDFVARLGAARVWVKSRQGNTRLMDARYVEVVPVLGSRVVDADGRDDGEIAFSFPVLHGSEGRGTVMMTRIKDGERVFVHGSDIQLLDEEAVAVIRAWEPDIVFVDGPPVYLGVLSDDARAAAFARGVRLAQAVEVLVCDHHLLRSPAGADWLKQVAAASGGRVMDAATFMGKKPELLEAARRGLYAQDRDRC